MKISFGVFLVCAVSVLAMQSSLASAPTIEGAIALAASGNAATVDGNFANSGRFNVITATSRVTSGDTSYSFDGDAAVAAEGQNAGANSVIQNAISVADVNLRGVGVALPFGGQTVSVAAASNDGSNEHNLDYPGYISSNPSGPGGNGGTGGTGGNGGNGGNGGGTSPGGQGLTPIGSDPYGAFYESFNGSAGVFVAAQNVGDNSLMQNAVSIGEIQTGKGARLEVAAATSRNDATNRDNVAYSFDTPTATSIRNSADGSEGIIGLNQNAAPNSIVQNSVGLTAVVLKPMGSAGLGGVVAGSVNCGVDAGNVASTMYEYNSTTMSDSLNGSAGILEAAQNAGSNSELQNAATLSVVAPGN